MRSQTRLLILFLLMGCQTLPVTGKAKVAARPATAGLPSTLPSLTGATTTVASVEPVAKPVQAATLTGVVRVPDWIISNNGGNIVSNNSGSVISNNGGSALARYRLSASEEVPLAGVTVALLDGAGQPVLGATGQPLSAQTDAQGRYVFDSALPAKSLILRVVLPEQKGQVQAIAPKDGRGQDINLDWVSSLTSTYIVTQYVNTQSERQQTIDRLPAAVETETRTVAQNALASSATVIPDNWSENQIVSVVDALRQRVAAFDQQMEKVRQLLIVAGLSNLGEGQAATSVFFGSVQQMLYSPDGSLYVIEDRLWRIRPDGILVSVLGKGDVAPPDANGLAASRVALKALECRRIGFDDANRLIVVTLDTILRIEADNTVTVLATGIKTDKLHLLGGDARGVDYIDGNLPAAEQSITGIFRRMLLQPGSAPTERTRYALPLGMMLKGIGYVPDQGATVKLTGYSTGHSLHWWPQDAAAPEPLVLDVSSTDGAIIDHKGRILARNAQGNLVVWQHPKEAPQILSSWDWSFRTACVGSSTRDVFVAENGLIYRVNPVGKSIIAGTEPAQSDQVLAGHLSLGAPSAMTVDAVGNLFVFDNRTRILHWIKPDQSVSQINYRERVPGSVTSLDNLNIIKLVPDITGFLFALVRDKQNGTGDYIVRIALSSSRNDLVFLQQKGSQIADFDINSAGDMAMLINNLSNGEPDGVLVRKRDTSIESVFQGENENSFHAGDRNLRWAPDGRLTMFGRGELVRIEADRRLTTILSDPDFIGSVQAPTGRVTYLPDGALAIVSPTQNQLWRVNPSDSRVDILAGQGGIAYTGGSVDETLGKVGDPVVTKDGDLLLLDITGRHVKRLPQSAWKGKSLPQRPQPAAATP